jgi:hypothetical protein
VGELRTQSNLFDMPLYEDQFTRLLQGTWELAHIARYKTAFQPNAAAGGIITSMSKKRIHNGAFNAKKLFHLFSPVSTRYHARDEFSVEAAEGSTASRQLHNRDAQGRLQVHQTYSEGSMVNTAAALLDAGGDPHDAHRGSPTSGTSSRPSAPVAARAPAASPSRPTSTAAAGADTSYHQTGKGATGSTAASGGASKKFPDIPRYVFDGRLIMLNIGRYRQQPHPPVLPASCALLIPVATRFFAGGLLPEEGWLTVNSQVCPQ